MYKRNIGENSQYNNQLLTLIPRSERENAFNLNFKFDDDLTFSFFFFFFTCSFINAHKYIEGISQLSV